MQASILRSARAMRMPRKMGINSTRSWALVPRDRGQPFHGIVGTDSTRRWAAGLTDGFMGSGLCWQGKACVAGGGLSHAFSGQFEPVGGVDKTIGAGVGQGWIADGLKPVRDGQLACDDG